MFNKTKFKLVIPIWNCLEWLPRSFDSIHSQSYRGFDVIVVDDASSEPGLWEWIERYCQERGWTLLRNSSRVGPLGSMVWAARVGGFDDEDVIVRLDGDDWFVDDEVLSYLDSIYASGKYDLTYGQYERHPGGERGCAAPYSKEVIDQRLYRSAPTRWCSLQTFKAFLWKAIKDEDLRGPGGNYFRWCVDHAYMNPMLEMVGECFFAVDKVIYIYNQLNTNSLTKREQWVMDLNIAYIEGMARYDLLERCRK